LYINDWKSIDRTAVKTWSFKICQSCRSSKTAAAEGIRRGHSAGGIPRAHRASTHIAGSTAGSAEFSYTHAADAMLHFTLVSLTAAVALIAYGERRGHRWR
jgi:hypothetical protein